LCFTVRLSAKECPEGKVYSQSMSRCPRTCETLYQPMAKSCYSDPFSGCECMPGKVLLGDQCIAPSQCPCLHYGTYYQSGETVTMGCNTW